jgi:hypothetical protein
VFKNRVDRRFSRLSSFFSSIIILWQMAFGEGKRKEESGLPREYQRVSFAPISFISFVVGQRARATEMT